MAQDTSSGALGSTAEGIRGSAWRNGTFRRLWAGQAISMLGDQCHRVALLWFLANTAGGARSTTLLAVAMAAPTALFGIFAGAVADRFDRGRILIGTDVGRALLAFLIALVLPLAGSSAAVYVASALLVLLGLAFNPAVQASLPRVVGESRTALVSGDSWLIGTAMVASTAGPVLATLLYWFDPSRLIMLNAVTFLVSAALLWTIRPKLAAAAPRPGPEPGARSVRDVLQAARAGGRYVRADPVLRPQFLTFPVMETLLYSTAFILPVFLVDRGFGSGVFGILMAVWMAGRVAGLALLRLSGLRARRGVVFAANFLVQGVGVLAVAAWPQVAIMAASLFVAGLPSGAAQVAMSTYVQSQVPDERRGVVFGALSSRVMWLMPLGPVVLGLLAEQVGARQAIAWCGAGLLIGGAFLVSRRAVVAVR